MLLPLKTLNIIGAFRSVFCYSLTVGLLFVKLSVVQSFYRCQFFLSSSTSRLYSAGNC